MEQVIFTANRIKRIRPPEVPVEEWCDFRRDYENSMSLKEIGIKYCCDSRTVKRCIMLNKSSNDLGRQTAPKKLTPYRSRIDQLYQELQESSSVKGQYVPVYRISTKITEEIRTEGYTGCERAVRNYLREQYLDSAFSAITTDDDTGHKKLPQFSDRTCR